MSIDEVINTSEQFAAEFWKWFDSLDKETKNRFWYYSADMAKIYFYNRHYVKRNSVHRDEP